MTPLARRLQRVHTTTPSGGFIKPDESNTGVRPGSSLTLHTGDYTMSTDGESIANLHITGSLWLAANTISVDNCLVDGGIGVNQASGGNYFYPVKANQTLTYVDAPSLYSTGLDHLTVDHCRFGNICDTFSQLIDYDDGSRTFVARNLTITNCLFDRMQVYTGTGSPHFEAIHFFGIQTALVQNNVFDYWVNDASTRTHITAAVTFENSFSTGNACTNITFDSNYLYGGGYFQIYTPVQSSTLTNNAFHSYEGMAGVQYTANTGSFVQSGNTLDGAPFDLATA